MADDIQAKANKPTNTQATWMAERIVSVYRARDFVNPAVFSAALASVFQTYSAASGLMVSDPVNGLPSRLAFPPSLAEVREALDQNVFWARGLDLVVSKQEKANAAV